VAWAEAYLSTSGILIHPTVWPQYTNVTDRQTGQTDNGPIAKRANRFTNGRPNANDIHLLLVRKIVTPFY